MRHVHATTVTDPYTGRRYAVPAGGSGEPPPDPNEGGDGTGTDDDGTDDDGGDGDGDGEDGSEDGKDKRAGGEAALRADLARERKRRQEAEGKLADRDRENESDVDTARREAREEALAPARNLARRTAVSEAAGQVGFLDATDAYAALIADGELDGIEVDDETLTVVDGKAITDKLSKLAKRKPHLLTDDARAKLEGRSASGSNGSSVDGRGSGSGRPTDEGAWLVARR